MKLMGFAALYPSYNFYNFYNFCLTGKSLAVCQNRLSSPSRKNISLHPDGQIKGITPRVSPK
jgi:hypothetical protein